MDNNISYDERLAIAMDGRMKGLNCAQSVIAAFPDVLQIPADIALKVSTGFGAGMGGLGEACGALSGMVMLESMRADDSAAGKAGVYKIVKQLGDDFKEACGALRCKELKAPGAKKSCNDIIAEGIKIYHNYLHSK